MIIAAGRGRRTGTSRGWQGETHWDEPRPGAREFLQELNRRGYDVVVFTTRWRDDARAWLERHQLLQWVADVTDRKPAAHVFVDDRAVRFEGDFAHWEKRS